jgi:uncharacterized membrane protein HdeD (DUF308 family)
MDMLAARQAARTGVGIGVMVTILGVFAVIAPMFAGLTVTVMLGILLIAGGVSLGVFAFQSESFGTGALRFLFGGLFLVAGVVVMATPAQSLGVLTVVLASFFIAGGVMDIILALKLRPREGWGWMLFSGIVTVGLAALVVAQWPVSGIWAVGLYIGVSLIVHGAMLTTIGTAGQQALTHLQDKRIAVLERHLRSGVQALQETQAVLADHSAMLLALDNELRKKVSSSEVDPAIVALNEELGVARVEMKKAAESTKEAWDKTQSEANAAFEKLHQSASEITERLKNELGLGKENPPPQGPDS